MKRTTSQSTKRSKIRITFFDLFGGGQKVIADFYICANEREENKP